MNGNMTVREGGRLRKREVENEKGSKRERDRKMETELERERWRGRERAFICGFTPKETNKRPGWQTKEFHPVFLWMAGTMVLGCHLLLSQAK